MIEQIAKIYENIYNQELRNRESLDNKFSSRFTILIAIATAYVILLSTLFDKLCDNNCLNYDFLNTLFLILCSLFSVTTLLSIVFFYKCFFRLKKNYMVMPTSEIRMFHLYVYGNKLDNTQQEFDLYQYMVDSYQFCSFSNANTNSIREKYLIYFDNTETMSFVLAISTYFVLRLCGINIAWIF